MTQPTASSPTLDEGLKPLDAWWTVLAIDPLAVRLVRSVRDRPWVTPDRLTVAAHLLGVMVALLLARGTLLPAAVLFEVRFVLDCADGKLARVRGVSSLAGAFLDFVGDYLVVGACVVALGLWGGWGGHVPLWVAVALPGAYLASIAASQALSREMVATGREGPTSARRMPGSYRGWMARRRLRALPSRVDAEHGLLGVAPALTALADAPGVTAAAMWVALAYFSYEALHVSFVGHRLAASRDRSLAGSS